MKANPKKSGRELCCSLPRGGHNWRCRGPQKGRALFRGLKETDGNSDWSLWYFKESDSPLKCVYERKTTIIQDGIYSTFIISQKLCQAHYLISICSKAPECALMTPSLHQEAEVKEDQIHYPTERRKQRGRTGVECESRLQNQNLELPDTEWPVARRGGSQAGQASRLGVELSPGEQQMLKYFHLIELGWVFSQLSSNPLGFGCCFLPKFV